ncbi:MAG: hypothetical protein EXQ85_09715 [Alphaproteobacteria bacterium]|nr:hypothetical protein [Alphaproteobacteria bacterium]
MLVPILVLAFAGLPWSPSDKGVLRVAEHFDAARGFCLDVPGYKEGVKVDQPLQVHTCKQNLWREDEIFDQRSITHGILYMPTFGLCVQAEDASVGARLRLTDCRENVRQRWGYRSSGELVLAGSSALCVTVDAGEPRPTRRPEFVMRDVSLDTCAVDARARQGWAFAIP